MGWSSLQRLRHESALTRVVAAYALFSVCEYGLWIAVLVYAYGHGGATAAGLVAVAQLLPGALVAPVAAAAADRFAPSAVLATAYVAQGCGAAVMAIGAEAGAPPVVVYAGAVLTAASVCGIRPVQATLLPRLSGDAGGLTAVNAVLGWLESACIVVAGAAVGAGIAVGGIGDVFAVAVVALGAAALLVGPLHTVPLAASDDITTPFRDLSGAAGVVVRAPATRLLVGLLGAEFAVVGALDIVFVLLAVQVLHRGDAWVGYLNTAYGIGGMVVAGAAVLLVGRRLAPVLAAASVALAAALAATAYASSALGVMALLIVVGGSRAGFDVAARTLLQRSVPADLVGRVFGIGEAINTIGLAVGSALVPVLVAFGGARFAIIGCALVLPATVALTGRLVLHLDQLAVVPVVQIGLLRSVVIFRDLSTPALEGLAKALQPVEAATAHVLIREGDLGDRYYVIAVGTVEVTVHARPIRRMGHGEGFGEIALLRDVPRTATVTAVTPVLAYALEREPFLVAVQAHLPTRRRAADVVDALTGSHAGA